MLLHRMNKPLWYSAVLTVNVGVALSAVAQTQPGETGPAARTLEEIVVTATKRSERLSDVPISISVLGADSLADQQAVRLQDYFTQVPGLQLNRTSYGLSLAMRGITTGGSTNPTVGITIDDVPVGSSSSLTYASLAATDLDPSTLERVEALRGPQGTLYGAASLGGLLRYVTKRPQLNEFSGRFQVDGSTVDGGENGYGVRGSANVPLVDDKLAATVSGFFRHDPGVVDNLGTGAADVDSADVWGVRASTLWQASDNVSLRVSATYQSTQGDGDSNILSLRPDRPTNGFTQNYVAGSGIYDRSAQQYDATLNIALGWADLTAISGYGVSKRLDSRDNVATFSGLTSLATGRDDLGTIAFIDTKTNKFSQEIRLASPSGAQLEWLVGVFYTDEDSDASYNIYGTDLASGAIRATVFLDAFPSTFKESALFGSLTYHFTDRFDIQVGGRGSRNKQDYHEVIGGPLYETPDLVDASSKDDSFTYLFSPRFRFSPSSMIYGRVASGYRPGGPNPGAGFGTPSEYGADTTTSYELGLKSDFFGRALSVDASIYYIDWQDVQLQQRDPVTEFVYYTNAGGARSKGADVTVQATPLDGMKVAATFSYNDAELTEPTNGGIYGLPGDRLPFSAKTSATLSLDQEFPLGSSYTGFVGGTVTYLGKRAGQFAPSEDVARTQSPSFTTLDLRGGIHLSDWTLSVFARNLTDERGILSSATETAGGGTGRYLLNIVHPRTIGLSVTKEF